MIQQARINSSLLEILSELELDKIDDELIVRIWAQKRNVSRVTRNIKVIPKNSNQNFYIGDEICFGVQSNLDCYILLINEGTSGELTILFPNNFEMDNKIKAGVPYWYPNPDSKYVLQLNPPAGYEKVRAIGSHNQLNYKIIDEKFNILNQNFSESICTVFTQEH